MGTSRNDPSPRVPAWTPALAALGNQSVRPARQLAEVWRAAVAQRGQSLVEALAHPALPAVLDAAITQRERPEAAFDAFEAARTAAQAYGLQFDLARRAAMRAAARGLDLNHAAAEFFAEVTDYFVSRDLPSFVGAPGRVRDVAESESLRSTLRELARSTSIERARISGPEGWRRFVESAIQRLGKP
jgi:hypothetical protein